MRRVKKLRVVECPKLLEIKIIFDDGFSLTRMESESVMKKLIRSIAMILPSMPYMDCGVEKLKIK